MAATKRNALGKGLSALLSDADTDVTTKDTSVKVGGISEIPIAQIEANPFQPRTEFDKTALQELSDSIKVHGVIQPITVRKIGYDKYQLISGERRTRAAILAELQKIPAFVRVANDQEMLEMALIENIQRENLNAIEVALSYKRLIDECDLKQEELGDRVGKNRTTVNNYIRLLKLPSEIQAAIRDGKISMGHARAIINVENEDEQMAIFEDIVNNTLSVRKVEELVRVAAKKQKARPKTSNKADFSEFKEYQSSLQDKFGTKVAFKPKTNGKGDLVISFNSKNELKRILEDLL